MSQVYRKFPSTSFVNREVFFCRGLRSGLKLHYAKLAFPAT